MPRETLFRSVLDSPIGPLTLIVSERGVRKIHYGRLPAEEGMIDSPAQTRPLVRQLEEYFKRRRRDFDLPLDRAGTPFQMRVWNAVREIPYGKTASYGDVARTIGCNGSRPIGGANKRNPIPILVPCHRVIAADGSIGGYSGGACGGIEIKTRLLALEK
ncbi:MAG TPA: methylated-DNA--[protein]-cysteine S-methyltransferase [Terriglobales bacterium]|nr:methylated-DNA--[protein]-cysteine S-methyltransferase [Terriglobales bacterium]